MGSLQEFIDKYMISRQPVQCLPSAASSTAEDPLGVEDDAQTQQDFATFASWLSSLEAERALVQPVIPGIGGDTPSPNEGENSPQEIPASQPEPRDSEPEQTPEQHPAALGAPEVPPSSAPVCTLCYGKSSCITNNIWSRFLFEVPSKVISWSSVEYV